MTQQRREGAGIAGVVPYMFAQGVNAADLPPRAGLVEFIHLIEVKLRQNDHKAGWADCDPAWLMMKLQEEIGEVAQLLTQMYTAAGQPADLRRAHEYHTTTAEELIDAGAVVFMLLDVIGARIAALDAEESETRQP